MEPAPTPFFDAVPLQLPTGPVPDAVGALYADARQRAERTSALTGAERISAFVMCHGPTIYRIFHAMQALVPRSPAHFLELGSGLGLATCLADELGWAATGLEIEPRLVAEARLLATAHGRQVDLVCGSYRSPQGGALPVERADGSRRLLALGEVDVFFAYPWPAEKRYLSELVARHARAGALLVFYHGGLQWEVLRKRPVS